jgi:plasmid stability protein
MAQILIRDIEPGLMEKLKERARRNRRSVQAEVRLLLEQAANRDEARERMWQFADEMIKELEGRQHSDSVELIREQRER